MTKLLVTLNTGDITFTDFTYNNNKCNITYMFLSTVLSKTIYNKEVIIGIVIVSRILDLPEACSRTL
jgi:hypothetical protein